MKNTCLVTTAHLENPEYFQKTEKFIEYYKPHFDSIYIIDNGSRYYTGGPLDNQVYIMTQIPHLPRKSHLEYPYLWRAIYGLDIFFDEFIPLNKVVYMDNDFYIKSKKMMDWIDSIDSGWHTVYCPKHKFNETGFQVVHKDCKEYKDFVKDGEFWKHNGEVMETTLPVTNVNKELIGDRWSEYSNLETLEIDKSDFSAQTPLEWKVAFNG